MFSRSIGSESGKTTTTAFVTTTKAAVEMDNKIRSLLAEIIEMLNKKMLNWIEPKDVSSMIVDVKTRSLTWIGSAWLLKLGLSSFVKSISQRRRPNVP